MILSVTTDKVQFISRETLHLHVTLTDTQRFQIKDVIKTLTLNPGPCNRQHVAKHHRDNLVGQGQYQTARHSVNILFKIKSNQLIIT